jgi:selenocysteine-specific elongation factor
VRVVATAGHVDHGKSSLVLALTGTDPDRFAEEKARGLTIDLGFAFTELPSGETLAFVDVPGHVRFLKNMLAGVGAVEAAVLVVAANEGWMPQSEEHLRILDLLGVRHAIAVLTKAGVVDDDTLELARLELSEHLDTSGLAGIPIVACDSKSGRGLDDVRAALDTLVRDAPIAADHGRPRLWVDRVFAAKGAGTVITGTLAGGALAVDTDVVLVPGRRRARVRGLESHHERLAVARPGSRVAVNLSGIDHTDVQRGDALVLPGQWVETKTVDVRLTALPGVTFDRRGAYKAYAGSGEHDLRLRVLGGDGDGPVARLHFDQPLALAPGDRLVLRESGRQETVGGAEVLDVAPVGRAALAPSRLTLPLGRRILAGRPWLRPAEFVALAGLDPAGAEQMAADLVAGGHAVRAGEWLVDPAVMDGARAKARVAVGHHHEAAPLEPGIDLAALAAQLGLDAARTRAVVEADTGIVVEHGRARLPSHQPALLDDPATAKLLGALDATPFAPPAPVDVGARPELVRALVRAGALVDLDGVIMTATALASARELVAGHLRDHGTITVAQARDLLDSSRRYVLAILGRFDADGVTRRRGDERVPGPRAFS